MDKQLKNAIHQYCSNLEADMLERAVKGEAKYKGSWKNMTIAQLKREAYEEFLDRMVYESMREYLTRNH